MRFILGSSSPRRRELLRQYGFKFEIMSPSVEELPEKGESATTFVKRASRDKLKNILKEIKPENNTLILTADTIVVIKNKILG